MKLLIPLLLVAAFPAHAGEPVSFSLGILDQAERALEAEYREAKAAGNAAGALSNALHETFGDGRVPTELERAVIAGRISNWTERQSRLHFEYDEITQVKTETFLAHSFSTLALAHLDALQSLPEGNRGPLQERFEKLKKAYLEYHANRSLYGTPKDSFRIGSFEKFFRSARAYVESIERAFDSHGAKGRAHQLRRARQLQALGALLRGIWFNHYHILKGLGMLVAPEWTSLYRNAMSTVNRLALGTGRALGHTVELKWEEGVTALPATDENTINIYVCNHTDMLFDMVTLGKISELIGAPMMAVSKTGALPETLGFRAKAEGHPAVIGVGPDINGNRQDPVGTIISRLNAQRGRPYGQMITHVYIYPEGNLPPGLGDTRVVQPNFSRRLVQGIRDLGYGVNVVTLTSAEGHRFIGADRLFGPNEPGQEELDLHIHRPLNTAMVDQLLQEDQSLNYLIRATWATALPTDETRWAGQFRTHELARRLQNYVHDRNVASYLPRCADHLRGMAPAAIQAPTLPATLFRR